jgi:hypothetical protein
MLVTLLPVSVAGARTSDPRAAILRHDFQRHAGPSGHKRRHQGYAWNVVLAQPTGYAA